MLLYLALAGTDGTCIREFRLLVWRMVVEAAIDRGVTLPVSATDAGEWGFAFDLAHRNYSRPEHFCELGAI